VEVEQAIRRSIERTMEDLELIQHAVGVMPDHVHVVVSIPPRLAPAEVARRLKGASSRAVNQFLATPDSARFAWQQEYGVLTFGERALPEVIAYVSHQRERHAEQRLWPLLERTDDRDFSTSANLPARAGE
jgi:putative transposase